MTESSTATARLDDLAARPTTAGGLFVEHKSHRHVTLRDASLRRARWLPEPPWLPALGLTADSLMTRANIVTAALEVAGIVKVRLDRVLSNDELVAFGRRLGNVMVHDTSPKLRQQIDDGLVFNLREERAETTDDYALALISRNYLTLHAEVCVRPLNRQPRFIALLAVDPSPPDSGGQTVFVPMDAVCHRLAADELELLAEAHFSQFPESPPFFSWRDGRPVFSFRDFGDDLLWWRYVGPRAPLRDDEFNAALRTLLNAMYAPGLMFGICWRPAELLVWDNWRFFHGRTLIQPTDAPRRHFKNIKIN